MDPTRCYQHILDALRTKDDAEARRAASALRDWLETGGCFPEGQNPVCVEFLLNRLLQPACAANVDQFPFLSITCYDCDAGQHIASIEQALIEGWTEIEADEKLRVTSHLGICPECRRAQDRELLEWRWVLIRAAIFRRDLFSIDLE
ncbi:MAG: hypothetical protein R3C59_10920 [Planctomycetaceae bacterium]